MSLCFATPNVESKCKACGQISTPAHVNKTAGKSEVYCSRCCPMCHSQTDIQFADTRLDEAEKPRLSRQCQQILERLQRGTVTNLELSNIALKYTSGISDLRKSGFKIEVKEREHETGLVVYELIDPAADL